MRHATIGSPLGDVMLVADGDALVGVYFLDQRYMPPAERVGDTVDAAGDAVLGTTAAELAAYFAGDAPTFMARRAPRGGEFAQAVWEALLDIPYGATTTYGALASRLGQPGGAQAVGQAVGHNPLAVVIPCHRVVGADGSLTGYAGGLDRKRFLLDLEGVPSQLSLM